MHKKNYFSILIITIFLISCIYSLSVFEASVNLQKIDEEIDIINPIEITEESTASDGWFSGESVKSEISHNIQGFDFDYFSVQDTTDFSIYEQNRQDSYSDNSQYYRYQVSWEPAIGGTSYLIYGRICCGGVGTLTYQQRLRSYDGVAADYTDMADGTYDVSSSMLDSLGYLYFYYEIEFNSGGNTLDLEFFIFNATAYYGETSVYAVDEVLGSTFADLYSIDLETDVFIFQRNLIENKIRSEYQYVSDTVMIHRFIIPSVPYAKNIKIYPPTTWVYSSINPYAIVSLVGIDYIIASPTELTYEVLFTSEHSYLLALEDVTSDYFVGNGNFETGTLVDCSNLHLQVADTLEVSTEISSEGYHSCHMIDNDGDDSYFNAEIDYRGTIYVSYDIYFVSGTTTSSVRFYYRNVNDGWSYIMIYTGNPTIFDRWITVYVCVDLLETEESNSRNFLFAFRDLNGELFMDNIQFFIPSTEIETTDLDEYQISSTFISWDGYQNPTIENEYVYNRILDRTFPEKPEYAYQDRIQNEFFYEGFTDSEGKSIWTLSEELEQREYEILVYAKNSWWDCLWTKEDLQNNAFWGHSTYGTVTQTVTDEYCKFETTHSSAHPQEYYYTEIGVGSLDGTEDVFIFDYKGTSNTDFEDALYKKSWYNDVTVFEPENSVWDYDNDNVITLEEWTTFDLWIDLDKSAYLDNNPYDDFQPRPDWAGGFASVYQIHYTITNTTNSDTTLYFKNVHTTKSVSCFFTPSYPYNIDFSEEELVDGWDFSEGDVESWYSAGVVTNKVVENGYYRYDTPLTGGAGLMISPITIGIDSDTYYYAYIRLKVNDSCYLILRDGGNELGEILATTSWTVFGIDLSLEGAWSGIETYLYIREGDDSQATRIYIDYVRIVHVEEVETYYSSTFLGIGSENDAWISAVYSDEVFLGFYSDPNVIPLNLTNGYHNISWLPVARQQKQKAFIYNDLHIYTYQVSDPANYYILLNPPSFDIAAGLLYVDIVTFWENCTVRIKMNDTWLGAAVPEGSSVWSFDSSSAGFYNFSCYIYNGLEVWDLLTTSITIPDPTIEIFTVHFDLVTPTGIGLSFETAKVYVNNSRIYSSEQYYFENAILAISVRDFFNNLLYSTIIQVTDNLDLSLPLDLIGQHVVNNYDVAANVTLISAADGNYTHSYIMAAKSSITILIYTNSYHILVEPLLKEFCNGTHIITYFATSSSYQDLGYEPSTYEITMDTELEQLNFVEPEEAHRAVVIAFILSAVLNAGLIAMIGAFIKWGFVKVWNGLFKYPNVALNWLLALFGVRPVSLMLEHKGGIEFVTPEEHQDIETKKKEGFM